MEEALFFNNAEIGRIFGISRQAVDDSQRRGMYKILLGLIDAFDYDFEEIAETAGVSLERVEAKFWELYDNYHHVERRRRGRNQQ